MSKIFSSHILISISHRVSYWMNVNILLFSFIHKARKRFKHSCLSSLIPLAHSTPSQATPSGLIFCYLSVLSFQTRPLISTRALLVTRIGLLSTHRRRRWSFVFPEWFKLLMLLRKNKFKHWLLLKMLGNLQNLPVSPRRKNLRYLFSPFFFLSCFAVGCCHVGLTLLVSVERQFLHVYVSPFGLWNVNEWFF